MPHHHHVLENRPPTTMKGSKGEKENSMKKKRKILSCKRVGFLLIAHNFYYIQNSVSYISFELVGCKFTQNLEDLFITMMKILPFACAYGMPMMSFYHILCACFFFEALIIDSAIGLSIRFSPYAHHCGDDYEKKNRSGSPWPYLYHTKPSG